MEYIKKHNMRATSGLSHWNCRLLRKTGTLVMGVVREWNDVWMRSIINNILNPATSIKICIHKSYTYIKYCLYLKSHFLSFIFLLGPEKSRVLLSSHILFLFRVLHHKPLGLISWPFLWVAYFLSWLLWWSVSQFVLALFHLLLYKMMAALLSLDLDSDESLFR